MMPAARIPRIRFIGVALVVLASCGEAPYGVDPQLVERPGPGTPPPPTPAPSDAEWIHIAHSNGTITGPLVEGRSPAWSPDGKTIAFDRGGFVHLIGVDGSGARTLSAGSEPAWSPDGKKVVFTAPDGIAVMNADGSAVSLIVAHDFRDDSYEPWDMGVGHPAWSPDGTRIAFEHLGDGDTLPSQIFTCLADGTAVQPLTLSADGRHYSESYPSWSANGAGIVFWSYGYGLAEVASAGGYPRSIHHDFPAVSYGANPDVSPDQSTIAFSKSTHGGAPSIWLIAPNGGALRMLITNAYDAAWSRDGTRIAFVRRGATAVP